MNHSQQPIQLPQQAVAEPAPPRMPGVFSRWLQSNPLVVDRIIAGTYVFGQLLMFLVAGGAFNDVSDEYLRGTLFDFRGAWLVLVAISVVAVFVALLFRRRLPEIGCGVAIAAIYAEPTYFGVANFIAVFVFIYTASACISNRRGWWCTLIGTVGCMILGLGEIYPGAGGPDLTPTEVGQRMVAGLIFGGMSMLIAQLNGMYVGGRRRYMSSLLSYAETLKLQRDTRALLAASQERARIAREMHDIIAHSLTVVVTLVEGARVAPPEKSARALELASDAGRDALAEVRRLLGVLREERPAALAAIDEAAAEVNRGQFASAAKAVDGQAAAAAVTAGITVRASAESGVAAGAAGAEAGELAAPLAPQPGFAQLEELRERFSVAGLNLSWQVPSPLPRLDAARELTVYRAVQEALTNTLRYAGVGARVSVQLAFISDPLEDGGESGTPRLSVLVRDYGPVDGAKLAPFPGAGRGLAGVRERAALYGGAVSLGPIADEHGGGFHVLMQLPLLMPQVSAGAGADDVAPDAASDAETPSTPAAPRATQAPSQENAQLADSQLADSQLADSAHCAQASTPHESATPEENDDDN